MTEQDQLVGAPVVDPTGATLGTVTSLLVDPARLDARWLAVALPGGGQAVVPVEVASTDGAGVLTIPYRLADLTAAPPVEGPVLTAATADALLRHYGFPPDPR